MTDAGRLHGLLVERFPDLAIEFDPPEVASGIWLINILRKNAAPVVVDWRADRGFGISTPGPDDYGMGANETFGDAEGAFSRVVQLVLSGGSSTPALGVGSMGLREALGTTQVP